MTPHVSHVEVLETELVLTSSKVRLNRPMTAPRYALEEPLNRRDSGMALMSMSLPSASEHDSMAFSARATQSRCSQRPAAHVHHACARTQRDIARMLPGSCGLHG